MPTVGYSAKAAAARHRGALMAEDDHRDNATGASSALGRVVQVEQAGQGQARFSIVRITPETASSFLAVKRPAGRRNQTAVAAYAQAMRTGEWVLNGMPIILSRNGVMLDGLQRLYACIEAKTPFVTVLAEERAGRHDPHHRSAASPLVHRSARDAWHPASGGGREPPRQTDPL